jgi:hypothetical protein
MKKVLYLISAIGLTFTLLSWGFTGHRSIGRIAENNLSPKAKKTVQELLGDQSLADVSTWADEVRSQPEYRATASWHFLNVPLGLNHADFQKQVEGMQTANVFSALLKAEHELLYPGTSKEKKIEALKFIVHFVGDIHQPMHISRAEDKGGNTIQLNYEGKGTNLHSLWDSKMLDHQGLSVEQIAEKYKPTPKQIKQWQSTSQIDWAWESYQISSKLYSEVDSMKTRSIDDSYYQNHIQIVNLRIEQAGIRLATILNEIFKGGNINSELIPPPEL